MRPLEFNCCTLGVQINGDIKAKTDHCYFQEHKVLVLQKKYHWALNKERGYPKNLKTKKTHVYLDPIPQLSKFMVVFLCIANSLSCNFCEQVQISQQKL